MYLHHDCGHGYCQDTTSRQFIAQSSFKRQSMYFPTFLMNRRPPVTRDAWTVFCHLLFCMWACAEYLQATHKGTLQLSNNRHLENARKWAGQRAEKAQRCFPSPTQPSLLRDACLHVQHCKLHNGLAFRVEVPIRSLKAFALFLLKWSVNT